MNNYNMYKLSRELLEAYNIEEHSKKPFGQALKILASAADITQPPLAKALKVTATTIHNYYNGYRTKPDLDFILRCADFFDVKPSYFREYRINQINEKLVEYPELIDIVSRALSDPEKLIKDFKDEHDEYKQNLRKYGFKVKV